MKVFYEKINLAWLKKVELIAIVLFVCVANVDATQMREIMNNFAKEPGYVQPIATFTATLQNSNLHSSARVAKGFGIGFDIPITMAFVDNDDYYYTKTYSTGCDNVEAFHANELANGNNTGYIPGSCPAGSTGKIKVPTMWGPNTNQKIYTYEPTMSGDPGYTLRTTGNVSDGLDVFADYFVPRNVPLLMPELNVSYFYTRLKYRYIGTFGGMVGAQEFKARLNFNTIGIQHDIRSFIKKEIPVDISLTLNFSFWNLSAQVDEEDVDGELDLRGFNTFTGIVVGKNVNKWFIPYMEMGWETSRMKTGGDMVEIQDDGTTAPIQPGLNLKGRNAFKLALGVTLRPSASTWHFGVNQSFGVQRATSISFMNYNKESKDE